MKKTIILFTAISIMLILSTVSCGDANPTAPETNYITNTVTNTQTSTVTNNVTNNITNNVYIVKPRFANLLGTWAEKGTYKNKAVFSPGGYAKPNSSWEYYSKVVYTNEAEGYFIIKITNHKGDSSQEGKFTRVHYSGYHNDSGKETIYFAEAYPQTNSLENARDHQSIDSHISMWGDPYTNALCEPGFEGLIGKWATDGSYVSKTEISSGGYAKPNSSWEYYAEVVYTNDTKGYFVIKITNHKGDSKQVGKYTRVYWGGYISNSTEKRVYFAEAYPQVDSLNEAKTNQSIATHVKYGFGDANTNY